MRALLFDVFGTLVDWRSGIAREATRLLGLSEDDAGAFAHRSGVQAGELGFLAPGCALLIAQKAPAAARKRDQNDAATNDPAHATRHARTM